MPSIVPGFEYDIFISYRHNDNRSDWVTDFVKSLQEEVAAAIKEPVSVYFDINPHDGLLETHNVDKSLERKLKCLIFIPIISQTYCDPKSFAWQHEFCTFNKLAKEDQFGRDIKLSNGNVSSRILPIKIHDLDPDDKAAIENEIGGVLRSIEFIFKSAGVNRPLHAHEEHAQDNQNKTFYRDQINKVAIAIKEILSALKAPALQLQHTLKREKLFIPTTKKKRFIAVIAGSILTLMIVGYFLFSKVDFIGGVEPIDKSIAVLAFVDMSPSHDQEYLGDGISEEIINVLAQTEGLKVIARSSSFQFKGKNEDLRTIGKLLGVSTVLQGSLVRLEDRVKVTVQLINTADGSHIWSKRFDQKVNDIFQMQDAIAREVAEAFKTTIETSATSERKQKWNEEAYRLYQKGRFFYERAGKDDWQRAHEHFYKSMMLDSNQAIVLTFLANCEFNTERHNEGIKHLEKSYELDPKLPETLVIMSEMAISNGDLLAGKQLMEKAIESNSSNSMVLRSISGISSVFGKYDQCMSFAKQAVKLDPLQPFCFTYLGAAHMLLQEYDSAVKAYERVAELSPDFRELDFNLTEAYLMAGDFEKASREIERMDDVEKRIFSCVLNFKKGDKVKSDDELKLLKKEKGRNGEIIKAFAFIHAQRGETVQAVNYLEQAYKEGYKLNWILSDPSFTSLHTNPQFRMLLKKIKLVE